MTGRLTADACKSGTSIRPVGKPAGRVVSRYGFHMIGTWHGLVVDCSNPRELASFYERLLGYIRVNDFDDWVVIGKSADHPGIAFQQIPNYTRPVWPEGTVPTQMHLDIRVDDIPGACAAAIQYGAILLRENDDRCWVLADPEGHPFCLVRM